MIWTPQMRCLKPADGCTSAICVIKLLRRYFKAFWCSKKVEPAPFTRNLLNLAQSCGLGLLLSDEHKAFVGELMPLNIDALSVL